ncbi:MULTISPECIES: helix-turn-helix transcriptional regulator [unclassified Archaeoglobus]|jgi:uncharacterized membrane protein|uniref:helix-turn-helix transcriptional regulator n=1 Tax=unclassified Archaeoglobus TaxID=2643606 RepID=UPI0025C16E80|nr:MULTISPECIES: MarR family transcriptional regulator [unclassified Archaeoglobus]
MELRNSEVVMLVGGVVLLFLYLTFSPMSHHYMMMGPFYMGILPVIFGVGGLALIAIAIYSSLSRSQDSEVLPEPEVSESPDERSSERLETAMRLLNEDEAMVLRLIAENEGITQDSLRARTEFSNSKISMIVKKLEERDLIIRERFGKTYKIYLSEWVKG